MKSIVKLQNGKEVEVVCPCVKTVKNAMKAGSGMDQTIYILSAVCNMTPDEVENLPFPDYTNLLEAVTPFLGKQAR